MFLLSLMAMCLLFVPNVSATSTDNLETYQTAALYFLPDYSPSEIGKSGASKCNQLGYSYSETNCAPPKILKDKCPAGNAYKECYCAGSITCSGYASSSNPYSSSTGASKTSCIDCAGNTLYNWSCSSSTCSSYSLTSCPSNGNCSQCCDGYYKLNSCQSGYNVSGNSCIKACTDTCSSKGYYSSRPSGKTCSTTTVCGSTCYYNCVDTHTHSYSCPSGYSSTNSWGSSALTAAKTCSCGQTSGTCYKEALDPSTNCTTESTLKYLYSDKSVSDTLNSSKTLIGIVVDELNRLAIALDAGNVAWGGDGIDIPTLNNVAGIYGGTWDLDRCRWQTRDRDGQSNTQAILAYGSANGISYPAAEYVNSYHPAACSSSSWCGAGKWFLPSVYELYPMLDQRVELKKVLSNLGGTTNDRNGNGDYWVKASNEFTAQVSGYLYVNQGAAGRDEKTFKGQVRPFIKY